MAARNEPNLYSVPFGSVPMATNDYNELANKPEINGHVLRGEMSLSDLGVPTKTSELDNDAGFITESALPTKVSELENDSEFTTKTYVDDEITAVKNIIDKYDGITAIDTFLAQETFTSTFDNLATSIQTALTAIKTALTTGQFAEIKALKISTIGNLHPLTTIVIDSSTVISSLSIEWQGLLYQSNAIKAIDISQEKVLSLSMTNDTNTDNYDSYVGDSTAYTFTIEYTKYKTINLT